MTLRVIDAPTSYPLSLEEAKAQLRITDNGSDLVIKGLIASATRLCETLVQRVFAQRTFEWVMPCWRNELLVPIAPVSARDISSIKYVDWSTQTQQTLDPLAYVVQPRGDSVVIFPKFGTFWPIAFAHASEPIVVAFAAGYDDLGDLPANVKTAILLQLRHLYTLGETSLALSSETVFGVGAKQYQISPELKSLVPDAVTHLMLSEVW